MTQEGTKLEKHLHIVSFNVPYPADYGGVIDVFYRIRYLAQLGVRIHLHCYTYGRQESPELAQICESVHYYRRDMSLFRQFSKRPFIVNSRSSKYLIDNLNKDNYPILLEGIHSCDILERIDTVDRQIIVRAHNVEQHYYAALAENEKNLMKRGYYRLESSKLKRYEPILKHASSVLTVTDADKRFFETIGIKNIVVIPCFHAGDSINSLRGKGDYALYHSNLSVAENQQAALWLADNVFSRFRGHVVIAGRNPDRAFIDHIKQYSNIRLVDSPSQDTMLELQRNAQVNVLYTEQPTGLKLKLLNSLFEGRHCLVNSMMLSGTKLSTLCHVADSADFMLESLEALMNQPFGDKDIENRQSVLNKTYGNEHNAKLILNLLR